MTTARRSRQEISSWRPPPPGRAVTADPPPSSRNQLHDRELLRRPEAYPQRMATLRLPPSQMRRRPARSIFGQHLSGSALVASGSAEPVAQESGNNG